MTTREAQRRMLADDPVLAAIWNATPTCERYWLDGYAILLRHPARIRNLDALTPAEIAERMAQIRAAAALAEPKEESDGTGAGE